jgi:hypothetical protein
MSIKQLKSNIIFEDENNFNPQIEEDDDGLYLVYNENTYIPIGKTQFREGLEVDVELVAKPSKKIKKALSAPKKIRLVVVGYGLEEVWELMN